MSNRVTKSVIYLVGLTGFGYLLAKAVAPSDDETRKKLGIEDEAALTNQQKRTKLAMERLKLAAGLPVENPESKK
ncbi:hypothetical protein ACJMK2_037921 [Sinanodonta woodiana]|uniref:Ubiquinol-cytochrome-c reductase complex assembly factor 3 n=1 Tax=Sinanodonta woodiana TaxID=1069815 RepID=A0ABD3WR51_SINWO